jgi:hypothetical protein
MDGKEVMHNINRLIKHHVWDEDHVYTDFVTTRNTPIIPQTTPKQHDLIIFPTEISEQHKCVFGVGKVIEIEGKNIFFQWLGSKPLAEASKPFLPGWVDLKDNKGYYSTRKIHKSHPPWTNKDTATEITINDVIATGSDLLNSNHKIAENFRRIIERATGEHITWGASKHSSGVCCIGLLMLLMLVLHGIVADVGAA